MYKFAIIFLIAFFLSTNVLAKEAKLGFVNTEKIFEEAPQAIAARERLEREFSTRQQDILNVEKRIQQLEQKLERDGPTMSQKDRVNLERDINRRTRDLRVLQAEFQEDLAIRQNEEIRNLQREVADIIANYAKQRSFDIILTDGVFYASDTVDITSDILRLLGAR